MIDLREAPRTYDLTTPGGAASAVMQTVAPLVALAFGVVNLGELWGIILAAAAAIILAMWVGPAWICWTRRNVAEVRRLEHEAELLTERIRLAEIALERDKQRGENLSYMVRMDHEQIQYAWELERAAPVNIEGEAVTWTVGGMVMPVTFALDWLEKWEARRAKGDDQLPAQSDWNDARYREQCREYNNAIITTLVKLGYVRSSGSQYPARWNNPDDERYKWRALKLIGFHRALANARGILEEQENNDNE